MVPFNGRRLRAKRGHSPFPCSALGRVVLASKARRENEGLGRTKLSSLSGDVTVYIDSQRVSANEVMGIKSY